MPLIKLALRTGVNRDVTNYTNEGGWFSSNKVRFFSGFPQKIGGWAKLTTTAFVGVCRSLFVWAQNAYNFMAMGTNQKVYIESGATLTDITPIRVSFGTPDTDNCFETDGSTTTVTVNITSHGATAGSYVTFAGATGPVGGVPAGELNTEHSITSVVNANSFTITVTTASTSVVAAGGGTSITADFQVNIGTGLNVSGYGWGVTSWGSGPWGYGSGTPMYSPLRLIHFTKYYSDLLFNIRFGDIFYWPFDNTLNTRAVYLKNESGASDVPEEVTQVLMAQDNGHLLAFGCTPYGGGDRDPLLIRWANQNDIVNWTVNDLTTAGFLRVQSGSAIVKAVPSYQEILVFTESSLSSLQYTGTLDVFSITEISPSISVLSPNAVIVVKNVAYWMGHDKFYQYSGRVETLPCTLLRHVFDDFNIDQCDQFYAGANENFDEVWWFYCSSTSDVIDRYVIYNYTDGSWAYGDCTEGLDRTAWIDSPLRSRPQAAGYANKYIYDHEVGCDADGVAFTATITSSDLSLDAGDNYMLLRRIIPDVDFSGSEAGSSPTLNMTVKPRDFPGAAYDVDNAEGQSFPRAVTRSATVPVQQYTKQVFVRARARQIGLTVESSGTTGVHWRLGTPRADVRPDGRRA